MKPTSEQERIESLDVLRGFALLGILLLNIVGFGMVSTYYSDPGLGISSSTDLFVWSGSELFAEGAMRCLFSILFGAGVVLFTTGENAKGGALHYKRNFWLLVFGGIDMFILLWTGDILIVYALAGFLLFTVRNVSVKRLLISAGLLLALITAMYGLTAFGLEMSRQASEQVAATPDPSNLDSGLVEMAAGYDEFIRDFRQSEEATAEELAARRGSYAQAFAWTLDAGVEILTFVVPIYLFWDALVMMMIGMALFKSGVLQGKKPTAFYVRMAVIGFVVGLLFNGYEVNKAIQNDFAILSVFAQMQWTYHFGRLGTALGWLGLVMLVLHKGFLRSLTGRLAAVGRMALTNYLMHSVICLIVFTGLGLGLVGELSRAQLYWVVLGIWVFQLWASPWWLARYRFGPVEWLWRLLTYGTAPENRRQTI
ncbi:MAG: DUF418 domain-containing protein [Pseudomonadota bacterium]